MNIGFSILFAVSSLIPGFFVFNFFKDAMAEYKASGKYFWETLLSSPTLFFLSLAVTLGLLALSVICLVG